MATRTQKIVLCDRCGLTGDIVKRTIIHPATRRQITFDACDPCAKTISLAEWEQLMPKRPRATGNRKPVVSEAVVRQASKRVRRKPTPAG